MEVGEADEEGTEGIGEDIVVATEGVDRLALHGKRLLSQEQCTMAAGDT